MWFLHHKEYSQGTKQSYTSHLPSDGGILLPKWRSWVWTLAGAAAFQRDRMQRYRCTLKSKVVEIASERGWELFILKQRGLLAKEYLPTYYFARKGKGEMQGIEKIVCLVTFTWALPSVIRTKMSWKESAALWHPSCPPLCEDVLNVPLWVFYSTLMV